MARMPRNSKRQLAAATALLLLLVGGGLAAVTAGGERTTAPATRARMGGVPPRDIALAAQYLGMPATQLALELRSGKSLAEIAGARSGHSSAGLIGALVAAKQLRVSAVWAGLQRRVTAEVNHRRAGPGPAGSLGSARLGLFAARPRLVLTAASYLGVPVGQLRAELNSGQSVGEIADARGAGRSAAGLTDALQAVVKAKLADAVAAGRLTRTQTDALATRVAKRVRTFVNLRRRER